MEKVKQLLAHRLKVKLLVEKKCMRGVPRGGVLLYGDRRDERPTWVGLLSKITLKVGLFLNKAL